MKYIIVILGFFFAIIQVEAYAQQKNLAARIVILKPKEGKQADFEAGYKRHLEWHRQNKDRWVWHGWQVLGGERFGYFIDGTFGHTWEAFDTPVSPAADAADNAANVNPYADFLSLGHYVLMPEASNASLLEDAKPTPLLAVQWVRIKPGRQKEFEDVLQKWHEAIAKSANPRHHTVYRLVNGGEGFLYVMMFPLTKLSELQGDESWDEVLRKAFDDTTTKNLLEKLTSVERVTSELLRYRVDMSYIPVINGK